MYNNDNMIWNSYQPQKGVRLVPLDSSGLNRSEKYLLVEIKMECHQSILKANSITFAVHFEPKKYTLSGLDLSSSSVRFASEPSSSNMTFIRMVAPSEPSIDAWNYLKMSQEEFFIQIGSVINSWIGLSVLSASLLELAKEKNGKKMHEKYKNRLYYRQ